MLGILTNKTESATNLLSAPLGRPRFGWAMASELGGVADHPLAGVLGRKLLDAQHGCIGSKGA